MAASLLAILGVKRNQTIRVCQLAFGHYDCRFVPRISISRWKGCLMLSPFLPGDLIANGRLPAGWTNNELSEVRCSYNEEIITIYGVTRQTDLDL